MDELYAFPSSLLIDDNNFIAHEGHGMTLRDYFAAKAVQGLLSSDVVAPVEIFAIRSYAMADAMLKARNGN